MMQRKFGWRAGALALVSGVLGALLASAPAQAQCVGDCNDDGTVAINELITGVNIALGSTNISACPSFDVNDDEMVAINELILGVNNALSSCPVVNTPTATPTDTETPTPTATPTDTETPTPTATLTATAADTPTATLTATVADTPTATLTATVAGTPTATPIGDTPTATLTPTPTATPVIKAVCNIGAGSQLLLQTAALPLTLVPTGSATIECGAPGPDGTAECACEVVELDPLTIPAIGDVCISPAANCPPGKVDCDGGTPLDVDLNATHHIGTGMCSTNAECAVACDAHCATLGASYARLSYGCEGYCQGGERNEMECSADTDCPGAQCPGRDPVNHPDVCGCVCAANGIGNASRAGALNCTLGTQINVELPSNGRCGDFATIQLAPVCGGVSTETSTGVVNYANNAPNTTIPAAGPESVVGVNVTCDALRAQNVAGLKLVGQLGFFDSTLGDIRSRNTFVCQ